jgi:23S rRNA (uridine2552-2'-O)-methyltransferase
MSSKNPFSGKRQLKTRVKTARGRKPSSQRWLSRQLNDPYVAQAKKDGYRSRAAYKIIEIDDKFKFLKPGKRVIDLGCAPGGWSQIAATRVKSSKEKPLVVGIDLLPVPAIAGTVLIEHDFTKDDAPQMIMDAIGTNKVEIVLSDMAPNTIGHGATDHLRLMAILELAIHFAGEVLLPGGVFVAKVFQGGAQKEMLAELKKKFAVVKHFKPQASRSDSSEIYVVATGFRG